MRDDVPVIHAVTDDRTLLRPDFLVRAFGVMGVLGSRGALHLRARTAPARRLEAMAEALRQHAADTGAWLVVNDRLDVALGTGATAAQLTSRSLSVRDARRLAPTLALGASVHDAWSATAAARDGADWVVAGHMYSTPSHAGDEPAGTALVWEITRTLTVPCIAIGGVRPEHVSALREAGAHGVAAIRGIMGASDAEQAAREYLSSYEGHGDVR